MTNISFGVLFRPSVIWVASYSGP